MTDVDFTEDSCDIIKKISSFVDNNTVCYDIYEITNHQKQVDKTIGLRGPIAQQRADIDYIAMESGIELEG